jgi:hypothetical protein
LTDISFIYHFHPFLIIVIRKNLPW